MAKSAVVTRRGRRDGAPRIGAAAHAAQGLIRAPACAHRVGEGVPAVERDSRRV